MYVLRQPILDANRETFAYELLYSDASLGSFIKQESHKTAELLKSALTKFGVKTLLGAHKAFIKIDKKFLMHETIYTIPIGRFIFSIEANIEIDDSVVQRVVDLHKKGYVLAINDTYINHDVHQNISTILRYISYIKIDIKTEENNLILLEPYKIKKIFTEVESCRMYEKAKSFNYTYLQGYFFSKPKISEQKSLNPIYMEAVGLCNLLMSNAKIDKVVAAFENVPKISLQVLKFINSSYFTFHYHISSIKQVLTLMGREHLAQLLMLLLYSSSFEKRSESGSPLMRLVKSRSELMVEVAKKITQEESEALAGKAHFVALISLMDALLNLSMETILNQLSVEEEIKEALLQNRGLLGEIYIFAKNMEHFDVKAIESFSNKYHFNLEDLEKLTIQVLENTNKLDEI